MVTNIMLCMQYDGDKRNEWLIHCSVFDSFDKHCIRLYSEQLSLSLGNGCTTLCPTTFHLQ